MIGSARPSPWRRVSIGGPWDLGAPRKKKVRAKARKTFSLRSPGLPGQGVSPCRWALDRDRASSNPDLMLGQYYNGVGPQVAYRPRIQFFDLRSFRTVQIATTLLLAKSFDFSNSAFKCQSNFPPRKNAGDRSRLTFEPPARRRFGRN